MGRIGASVFARTARTSVERPAAAQPARTGPASNAYCSAFRSSRRTLVSSASIFSQRASTAIADTVNEFTTAICWKSAVEPGAMLVDSNHAAFEQTIDFKHGHREPSAAYRRPGEGDDLRRQSKLYQR